MQQKYPLILIGLALGTQAADGEQKNRFVDALRRYNYARISIEEMGALFATYTQDELSNPNKHELTPLMASVRKPEIIKLLLEFGADPRVQVNGQDVLTFAFKKAYTHPEDYRHPADISVRHSYSVVLDILKKEMGIESEKDAFTYAIKQGMEFTQEDKQRFAFNSTHSQRGKNRDFEMVRALLYKLDGYSIKGCSKK